MMIALAAGGLLYDLWASQKEHVWRWLQEWWCTRVELRSAQHRELCDAFLFWCSRRTDVFGSQNLCVGPPPSELEPAADNLKESQVALAPGFGRHVLSVSVGDGSMSSRRVVFTRDVDESMKHKGGFHRGSNGPTADEVITLTATGSDAREFLLRVLNDAHEEYRASLQGHAKVFSNDGGYWDQLCWRQYRREDTMQLTTAQTRILNEVKQFFASRQSYAALGVPWRRGYLLEGPPGTGKSSFISVAAGAVQAPMYILSLRDPQLNDATLLRAVNSIPCGSFLVLEDVDSIAVSATSEQSHAPSTISLSGLLNAIDGIAASEGRLLIMTANRPEVLPPALLRPGRIDQVIHFDQLSSVDARTMTQRLYASQLQSGGNPQTAPVPPDSKATKTAAELQHEVLQRLVYLPKANAS
ncbi:ATP-dependent chaperone, putative [Bodo saltans]|uniref:ATP-dependent chaperone, putative n=1 Tax=Bodo saltans TaxID=75058 RepID=A0A0S4IXD9_BODSA|nr:ATP-dependent chaperone, putative [Bodo saltans]|eukprot:CUG07479.1 ATP-dependent chaperone, putative [Bodo saltans]